MAIGSDDGWGRDSTRLGREWSVPGEKPPPVKEEWKIAHVVLFTFLIVVFGWLATLVYHLLTHPV
jgi:hypothetical protein